MFAVDKQLRGVANELSDRDLDGGGIVAARLDNRQGLFDEQHLALFVLVFLKPANISHQTWGQSRCNKNWNNNSNSVIENGVLFLKVIGGNVIGIFNYIKYLSNKIICYK